MQRKTPEYPHPEDYEYPGQRPEPFIREPDPPPDKRKEPPPPIIDPGRPPPSLPDVNVPGVPGKPKKPWRIPLDKPN